MPNYSVAHVIRLVIYALAVVRLTWLLHHDNGPFDVFDWLRDKLGVVVINDPYTDEPRQVGINELGRLLACPLCLSVWLSALALCSWWLAWTPLDVIALWLAIAAVSLMVFK